MARIAASRASREIRRCVRWIARERRQDIIAMGVREEMSKVMGVRRRLNFWLTRPTPLFGF